MAKKLQLQVPVPCQEEWEKMTNAGRGRFCASCQKTVIDFSNMSDREIALFFKRPSTGSVCGRFLEDQLNRDMEIPRKRIPWVKYFFQFLLPGFLISMKATAQGKVKVVEKKTNVAVKNSKLLKKDNSAKYTGSECTITQGIAAPVIIEPIIFEESTVQGKVVDENGTPVPFATVVIKGTKTGTAADSTGAFKVKPEGSWDSIYLVVLSVGFLPTEVKITKAHAATNSTIVLRLAARSMGEVVVVGQVRTHRKGMVMSVKAISVKDKIQALVKPEQFKFYPNPVPVGSTIHIQWNKKEYGDHSLQLFSQTGQLVFRKEINIDQKSRLLSIHLPLVLAGNYFLTITSDQTRKSYSEKIIIQ
jgi:carboxypeptidase-like protein/type IX secretion system substrate protein